MTLTNLNNHNYVTDHDIKIILENYVSNPNDYVVQQYTVLGASDKILGFMSDYWRLQVEVQHGGGGTKLLHFFIKAISRTNEAKASMAKYIKVFDKELNFYSIIKQQISKAGIQPWSPIFVAPLKEALVFEDLNVHQYINRNKFDPFDEKHTTQALQSLARFHASAIIFEETKSKTCHTTYRINDNYEEYLDTGAYQKNDPWFVQCMKSTLEVVKTYSKYSSNKKILETIESRWEKIWHDGLRLSGHSQKYRNVICHRDLWNNNILFHYDENAEPDDCLFVDYQAVRSQPPTGDIMVLLYCNLESNFRKNNIKRYLYYYYQQLKTLLHEHEISIDYVLSWEDYMESSKEQRLWGLVVSACLLPTLWVDEDVSVKTFSDNVKFNDVFMQNKAAFIKTMMNTNETYKTKIIGIFEEIVEHHCLGQ